MGLIDGSGSKYGTIMNDPCTGKKINLIMRRDQNRVEGRFNVQRSTFNGKVLMDGGTAGTAGRGGGKPQCWMGIPIRKLIRIQINIVYGWNGRSRVTTPLKNFSNGFEFTPNVGLNWRTEITIDSEYQVVRQRHSAQPLAVRA